MDKILILDFGSQTTQLIGRRIRELGVFSDIIDGSQALNKMELGGVKGLIFSGSPFSVYEVNAPAVDLEVYDLGLPILGICYGLQRLITDFGGEVKSLSKKEYGREKVFFKNSGTFFEGVPDGFTSWMSHGDSIETVPAGFTELARSESHPAALADLSRGFYGIQFHPEVTHCEYGNRILGNFIFGICGASAGWNMDTYLEESAIRIKNTAGTRKVLLLISGGVDSTVAAGLLLKTLPREQVHLMYIDTGMMRKGESVEVKQNLDTLGARHLHIIQAENDFLEALKGVEDPEEKRHLIGDTFVKVQQREIVTLELGDFLLAQGTLYTDMIESGKGVGNKAKVIKSHHNVRSPLIEEKRMRGLILEPLDRLYKDEVRALGRKLGIWDSIIQRHPFPGPGLAVRILGEVTREKCDILREVDYLYIGELKKRNLYHEIWQAFSVLLPVRSVGVAGDLRKYGWVVALRAVVSKDGMTADVYPFPSQDLLEISAIITNQVAEVGRVVYDISSKPPSTIEWE